MNEENWINDMTYMCSSCGLKFRVYFEEDSTTQFCPSCASRDLEMYEDDK